MRPRLLPAVLAAMALLLAAKLQALVVPARSPAPVIGLVTISMRGMPARL